MELHQEFTLDIELEPPMMVGEGPFGARIVASVATGTATGERISGDIAGAGADWMLMGKDGFARIDVRCQVQTIDNAAIYLRYEGLLELNEVALAALTTPGAETAWDDQYFRTASSRAATSAMPG